MKYSFYSFYLLTIVASVFAIYTARGYHPIASYFPILVCSCLFVLLSIALVKNIKDGTMNIGSLPESGLDLSYQAEEKTDYAKKQTIRFFVWIVLLIVGSQLFSFLYAVQIWMLTFFRMHGVGWIKGITLSAIAFFLIYYGLYVNAGLPIHRGMLLDFRGF